LTKYKKDFLKEFLKYRKRIGSISPSSKFLTKKMLEGIDFDNNRVIVEYGAGTGVFTRKIVSKMAQGTKLFVFELHEPFCKKLEEEFRDQPNVIIICDSAVNVLKYLQRENETHADSIISSLPFANFQTKLTIRILKASDRILVKDGTFIQYQYSLNVKRLLSKIFDLKSVEFVPINIPPAFIYICKKKQVSF